MSRDSIRDSFHSNDFGFNSTINGKTQEEHEAAFKVVGEIKHLHDLGWENYQWCYTKEEDCKENIKVGSMRIAQGCFAEFFSIYYNGYLRGDGNTLSESVSKCLQTAQKYAACRHHKYVSAEGYDNGLIRCTLCGFSGHTTIIRSLKEQIKHLTMQIEIEKEFAARNERDIREKGKSSYELLSESLKGLAEALSEPDDKSTTDEVQ